MEEEKKYVGCEYRDVTVARDMESLRTDSYAYFGWVMVGNPSAEPGFNSVRLKFKRERKIRNKIELNGLQRRFESCIKEIENLERSKNIGASIFAYVFGILGIVFIGLSMFSYLEGMTHRSIVVTNFGLIGLFLPYFGCLKVISRKTEKVKPLIDAYYEKIYDACEKASKLL